MSTTHTPQPTKITDIFDTEPCTRCGGTGRYSYCQRFGDMCFKCNGNKVAFTKKATPFVQELRARIKAMKSTTACNLTPGQNIALDENGHISSKWIGTNAGGRWVTITDITVTDEACGWSLGPDDERTPTYWYTVISYTDPADDGSAEFAPARSSARISGGLQVRTQFPGIYNDEVCADILARWEAARPRR
jgi:hypothetical protein